MPQDNRKTLPRLKQMLFSPLLIDMIKHILSNGTIHQTSDLIEFTYILLKHVHEEQSLTESTVSSLSSAQTIRLC
jgi:hypothetical protein